MDRDSSGLVGVVAIVCIFALMFLTWITFRVLEHRERMELIRRGQMPLPSSMRAMRYGYGYDPDLYANVQLRRGISVTFIGLALLIGLAFIGYTPYDRDEIFGHFVPGPWLLFGIIPMLVGMAQVIGSLVGGGRFRAPPRGFGAPSYGEGLGSPQSEESESSKKPPV